MLGCCGEGAADDAEAEAGLEEVVGVSVVGRRARWKEPDEHTRSALLNKHKRGWRATHGESSATFVGARASPLELRRRDRMDCPSRMSYRKSA